MGHQKLTASKADKKTPTHDRSRYLAVVGAAASVVGAGLTTATALGTNLAGGNWTAVLVIALVGLLCMTLAWTFVLLGRHQRQFVDLCSAYQDARAYFDRELAIGRAENGVLHRDLQAIGHLRAGIGELRRVALRQSSQPGRYQRMDDFADRALACFHNYFQEVLGCECSVSAHMVVGVGTAADPGTAERVQLKMISRSPEWRDDQPESRPYADAPDLQRFLRRPNNPRDFEAWVVENSLVAKYGVESARHFSRQTRAVASAPIRSTVPRDEERTGNELLGLLRVEATEQDIFENHHVDTVKLAAYALFDYLSMCRERYLALTDSATEPDQPLLTDARTISQPAP